MAGKVDRELDNLPQEQRELMTGLYAGIYYDYCRGEAIDAKEARESKGYQLWQRNRPDHRYLSDIEDMLNDTKYRNFKWSEEIR